MIYMYILYFLKKKSQSLISLSVRALRMRGVGGGGLDPAPFLSFSFFFVAFAKVECLYFAEVHRAGRRLADVERASDCLVRFCRHQT